jgi:N-acetylglucosaminyldiphosphoundecaprenol N-acetyl-beta-D-mannosaminyltransferase
MDEMSDPKVIKQINQSDADLLIVALGAKRGQEWIERNRGALNAPVISHLGAVINFVAGTVSRAPLWIQKSGLEWVWRIWEENSLFKRYWHDGMAFLKYYFNNLRPYKKLIAEQNNHPTHDLDTSFDQTTGTLFVTGDARFNQLEMLRQQLVELITEQRLLAIDFSGIATFDASFTGLLQLVNKHVSPYAPEGLKLNNLSVEHQAVLRYLNLGDKF